MASHYKGVLYQLFKSAKACDFDITYLEIGQTAFDLLVEEIGQQAEWHGEWLKFKDHYIRPRLDGRSE